LCDHFYHFTFEETLKEMDNFIAGFAYGVTTVIVGQPFDTIKTRMQAMSAVSTLSTARTLFRSDGFSGFYRGAVPLICGGGLMRSAQFGGYESAMGVLKKRFGTIDEDHKAFGIIDPTVVFAGFIGGICRGLVEGPFEYIKVRIQLGNAWRISDMFNGSSATLYRNSILFSTFVVYIDITKSVIDKDLHPFVTGALCSNMAWLTIWPMDVVKSQIQSGNYPGKSYMSLFISNFKTGSIFRGLMPGLARSTIANGCSMVVYKKVLELLKTN
jgi:solute carrier family 25 carnitine/acylcarnitine transporter 20/29